jgi:hypothetical protein
MISTVTGLVETPGLPHFTSVQLRCFFVALKIVGTTLSEYFFSLKDEKHGVVVPP